MSFTFKVGYALGSYRHQRTTLSDTWVVTHGRADMAPFVTCYVQQIDGSWTVIKPLDVIITSPTTLKITFSTPMKGEVIVH